MAVALKVDVRSSSRSWPNDSRFATKGSGLRRIGRNVGSRLGSLLSAWFALTFLLVADAGAMGLGAAVVQSGLGQPLRMSFPVSVQRDEEVGCVQVRAKGDDLPAVLNTRTAVIRNAFQTRIEIRSIQPVDEPAIGLVVSVGCASPISREYVIFLDPPIVAPTTEPAVDAGRTLPPARVDRAAPTRRTTAAPSTPRVGKPIVRKPTPAASPRVPRNRPRVAPPATSAEAPQAATPSTTRTPAPAAATPPATKGDRLTIVPTEPSASAPTPAASPLATPAPAASPGPITAAVAPATSGAVPAVPVTEPSPAAGLPSAASDSSEAAAREQAMRQQQADLQQQIKALSDQVAALKVQTSTLSTRNQTLEQSGFSSAVVWLLVLLAVIAIVVAGWMAWRYTQLRRSMEGTAWWTNNTGQAPPPGDRTVAPETRSGIVALDAGTRLAARAPEPEAAPLPASRTSTSNVERPRAAPPRPQRYAAQIDTDFTVSDIEAAMATVRTVSPPRDAPRPAAVDDAEFAPLGGPTLPSPFADPPPVAQQPVASPPQSSMTGPANVLTSRSGDDLGNFVDIDIPPLPSPRSSGSAGAAPAGGTTGRPASTDVTGRFADDETVPLDFKLDIPQTFDPLATDSMKTTIVDGANRPATMDFDLPSMPNALDFELPSATQVSSLTGAERSKHGATALDDLFAVRTEPGIDTILNLDERDGSPLSTTEVDRLTTTAIEGPSSDSIAPSTRALLARFADLMNQVDDVESTDPLRAIALLRQYVLRDEKIPTLLWLRLFQLYRKVDKKPVYEALAEHFSRRYDRPMVSWDQTLADRVPQTPLSAMGQVDTEIEALWGKEEGLERIRSLLCDRHLDDAVVFNAVLQRDLLDAAKVFPHSTDSQIGGGAGV